MNFEKKYRSAIEFSLKRQIIVMGTTHVESHVITTGKKQTMVHCSPIVTFYQHVAAQFENV